MPADPERVASVLRAARAPQQIDVRTQQITLKTRRGNLRVGPHGKIDGLWQIVRKELRTNAQVRQLCGGIQRNTLKAWRELETNPFPAPVWKVPAQRSPIELWSRTEVEEWLVQRRGSRESSK